jgi:hypothetical protein
VKNYFQCSMHRGTTTTTGWIEASGAKLGALVELKEFPGPLWKVDAVYGEGTPESQLKEHQRMHRGSLPSVERMQ